MLRSEAGPAGAAPAVLVVAPPPMQEVDWFGRHVPGWRREVAAACPACIRDVAKRPGAAFFDAGDVVESSAVDGIHLDSDAHRVLGVELARAVQALFVRR